MTYRIDRILKSCHWENLYFNLFVWIDSMMLSIGDARLVDSFYFFSLIASYVFIVAEKPLYMTKEKYIVMFILAATN